MTRLLELITLLSILCWCLADNVQLLRSKRGTRFYRVTCVDSQRVAVRSYRETWLRWRGQRVEYCRCALGGQERCHIVPVTNCYVSQCYNGGLCKEAVHTSDYICQCPAGFSGNQCEINNNEKCIVGQGEGYRGSWSISHTGAACINWNATSLRGRRFTAMKADASILGLGNHNFCRNPDGDNTPWCYVYKNTQIVWEFCSLPKCTEDKYQECVRSSGQAYRGTKSVTKSGSQCLPWDSPILKRKLYNAWRSDALELGLGSHKSCRNPDGDEGPWCHTFRNMQLTWELCDIPKCSRRNSIMSTLGPRAPTTNNNNNIASCGQRLDNSLNRPSFRIFGGRQSDIKDQPWQAAINVFHARRKMHFHRCGGVLIDSCWVLSAAHCFEAKDKAEKLEVILGRTFRKENSSSEQIFKVEKYWMHEKFDNESFDNDIALLKLKTDIGICAINSPEVFPVCLPKPDLKLPSWTQCEISGYGREREFSAEYSERVKRGYVRLWPNERCVPGVLSGRLVTSNMLCAGDTRGLDDACKGDSGGPLVCQHNNSMTLMGVISWGDGCGQRDKPGVYTRVTNYISWINEKMKASPV
ncbi:tissue-type plasminogen activator isoform X2 [Cynoglossus semilaevis]|uniref:tissue-type plasminogen activator isoform X2 n=1 Tax=Cynoglossus semilaevis TaxID=244447 RepID=UPI0004983958|nr:tissue-type plasminogen activator isoform X2 [Cynoglossus semilaevis]